MHIAIHFNADHPEFGGYYGEPCYEKVFRALLTGDVMNLDTEVFIGDVNFYQLQEHHLRAWTEARRGKWGQLYEGVGFLTTHNIFAIVLGNVEQSLADHIDQTLRSEDAYIGAVEVNATVGVHKALYELYLIPMFRLVNRECHLFWDGVTEDSKDEGLMEFLTQLPFSRVTFEAKLPFD